MSPSIVKVERGKAFFPVTNVGTADVWLTPHRVIATVQVATVVPDDSQIQFSVDVHSCTAAISSHEIGNNDTHLELPKFGNLNERER